MLCTGSNSSVKWPARGGLEVESQLLPVCCLEKVGNFFEKNTWKFRRNCWNLVGNWLDFPVAARDGQRS